MPNPKAQQFQFHTSKFDQKFTANEVALPSWTCPCTEQDSSWTSPYLIYEYNIFTEIELQVPQYGMNILALSGCVGDEQLSSHLTCSSRKHVWLTLADTLPCRTAQLLHSCEQLTLRPKSHRGRAATQTRRPVRCDVTDEARCWLLSARVSVSIRCCGRSYQQVAPRLTRHVGRAGGGARKSLGRPPPLRHFGPRNSQPDSVRPFKRRDAGLLLGPRVLPAATCRESIPLRRGKIEVKLVGFLFHTRVHEVYHKVVRYSCG